MGKHVNRELVLVALYNDLEHIIKQTDSHAFLLARTVLRHETKSLVGDGIIGPSSVISKVLKKLHTEKYLLTHRDIDTFDRSYYDDLEDALAVVKHYMRVSTNV